MNYNPNVELKTERQLLKVMLKRLEAVPRGCSVEKAALKTFAIFTRKHLY